MSYLSRQTGVFLTPVYRRALRAMLAELLNSQLEVTLAPSKRPEEAARGGMIRVILDQNAPWYRRFCAAHVSHRKDAGAKFKTRIKRQDTIEAIERMLKSHRASGFYEDAIIEHVPWFISDHKAAAAQRKKDARKKKPKEPGIAAQLDIGHYGQGPERENYYDPF